MNEEKHVFHGPEDIVKWLEWVEDNTSKIRKGYLFSQNYKLRKDIPEKNLVRVDKIEPEKFDNNQRILYKATYLIKPKNKIEFLEGCKQFFLITDDDLFLKIYYK